MVTIESGNKPGTFFVKNFPRTLSDKIKFGIPSYARTFTGEYWVVQDGFLAQVQLWVKQLNLTSQVSVVKSKKDDFYSVLFLTEDAPDFVVDAVWKILARKYHPDSPGGDNELFIQAKLAYDKIRS